MESTLSMVAAGYYCPKCRGTVFLNRWIASGDIPCPHCRQVLWFICKRFEGAVVITLLPGLMTGSESVQRFEEIAAAADASRIIVDLSHVHLITSMVLRMLVLLHKRLTGSGGRLKICGANRDVAEVFQVTKLDTVFDFHADDEAAWQSL